MNGCIGGPLYRSLVEYLITKILWWSGVGLSLSTFLPYLEGSHVAQFSRQITSVGPGLMNNYQKL